MEKMLSNKNNSVKWAETESQASYHPDLRITSETERSVALPGVTERCETKGEPEVDQTLCSPTALM